MPPQTTAQVFDPKTGTWGSFTPPGTTPTPTVAPAQAPQTGSLAGTMTTPPQTTAPLTSSQGATQNVPGAGLDPTSFMNVLNGVKQNFAANNALINAKNLLIKGLFTSPLSQDQIAQLPPDIAQVWNTGNRDAIQLQVAALNERIQGGTTNFSQSVNYLVNGYQSSLQQAEQNKKDALDTIQNMVNTYGKSAIAGLEVQYPDLKPYLEQLKGMPTLAETAATQKASSGGSSNVNTDNERALFNQFNGEPIVKDYNTILAKKLSVDSILNGKLGGPGDLAVVYEFMKGLDPTSVVRETEYDSAAKSGNIFAGAFAKFNGYLNPNGGFLPDSVKKDFQSIVNSKLKVQQTLYDNVKKQYEGVATRQGLNPQNVVIDYSAAAPTTDTDPISQLQTQLLPGEILVSREAQDGRHYVAITPDELWATDIKI